MKSPAAEADPPRPVRDAFAGRVFFKRLDMSVEALRWQEGVLSSIVPDGFRVVAPVRSRSGELVVEGWTAWPWLSGSHEERWDEIVAVGERFHGVLAGVKRPAFLDARDDRWARADRIAWGDAPAPPPAGPRSLAPSPTPGSPHLAALLAARTPVDAPCRLVHGDLSGNVLFADGLPPAVIDFSPYWRPAAYASAIVVVDAVLWHGADTNLLDLCAAPLLVRALLFRLLSEPDPAAAAVTYRPAVEAVLARSRRR